MTPEDFRIAGQEIHGDEWHRAIARSLGSYHPDGARDQIDDRLVRRWAAGERAIPAWVPAAMIDILDIKEIELRADADRVARLLAHLGFKRPERKRTLAERKES
jgi:hypothetical protein